MRDDLPPNVKRFFMKVENYLDTPLYFYGSVTRADYVANQSDIDVAIFTDNEYSTMAKLQHFLKVGRRDFDKIVWKITDQHLIYGYKVKYSTGGKNFPMCEFAIYNETFKERILNTFQLENELPLYLSWLLQLLKYFYYTCPLLTEKQYAYLKRMIFNTRKSAHSVFFVLKDDKDEDDKKDKVQQG